MPLALPPTLSHSSARVVATRISYDAPAVLRDAPITTVTLRDSSGATREGTHSRRAQQTRRRHVARPRRPSPIVGSIVPMTVHAWVRGDPPTTWPAAKIPVSFTFQLADPAGLGAAAFPEVRRRTPRMEPRELHCMARRSRGARRRHRRRRRHQRRDLARRRVARRARH